MIFEIFHCDPTRQTQLYSHFSSKSFATEHTAVVESRRWRYLQLYPANLLLVTNIMVLPFKLPHAGLQAFRKRFFYWRAVYYYRIAMQNDFLNRK
jgi:hypothetical protein